MIGLRVLHLVTPCDQSLAAHGAVNLIRWLSEHGHETAMVSASGERIAEVMAGGVTVIPYRVAGLRGMLNGRKNLIKAVGRWNPDLLHVHHLENLEEALRVADALGLPVVASCDALEPKQMAGPLHHPRVAWIGVPSDVHRAHFLSRLGLPRDRVTVLPCGVDLRYLTGSHPRPGDHVPVIGAIDHVGDATGLDDLISALAVLKRAGVAFRALIHSDGEGIGPIRVQAERAGFDEGQVRVGAWRPLAEVVPAMDLLVQPADHDQLTPAVLEAMAAGRPVVAVAGGGVTDVVHDGETGLLVPQHDPAALAGALREVVADRTRLRELGRKARDIVAQRYDLEAVGQAAVELYRTAVSGCDTTARMAGTSVFRRITEQRRTGT